MKEETVQATQLKWIKLQTAMIAGILVLLLAVGAFLGLQVNAVMKQVNALDLAKINATVASLQATAADLENVDMAVINEAVSSLKDAAKNLSQTDISAINEGIRSLSSAAENLQTLDVDQLNELIKTLETVAGQMEQTTSALSAVTKIFGR